MPAKKRKYTQRKPRRMFTNEYRQKALRRIRQLQRQHPAATIQNLCKQVGISPFNYSNWAKMERNGVFKSRPGKQVINRTPGSTRKVSGRHSLTLVVDGGSYALEVKSDDFELNQSGKVTSDKTLRETVDGAFFSKLSHA